MNFEDIIKVVGSAALSTHPVGVGVLAIINSFLGDDEKLPIGATGEEVKRSYNNLSAEQKAAIKEKELDLEIQQDRGWTRRYTEMCKADGQSTRPRIALMMAKVFCGTLLGFMIIIAYAVASEGFAVLNSPYVWQVFATLTAVPASLLAKYFGELRREQGNRLGAEKEGVFNKLFNSVIKKK